MIVYSSPHRKIITSVLILALAAPLFAHAALPPPPNGIPLDGDRIKVIAGNILANIWIGVVVFVIIAFLMIGSYFLLTKGDPEKARDARNALMWAIAGVVVMVLASSVVLIVKTALGL